VTLESWLEHDRALESAALLTLILLAKAIAKAGPDLLEGAPTRATFDPHRSAKATR
jgi:hypothetical protein